MTPRNLPKAKLDAAQAITDGLLSLAAAGELVERGDVVATLGFEAQWNGSVRLRKFVH
jgi:hypothetical protein